MKPLSRHTRIFQLPFPLVLESGGVLDDVRVAYRTWGRLNAARTNAVVVCHALTGNADADEWWEPLFGPGRALDPDRDFILCSNVLGSCYGTTGPASLDSHGRRFAAAFPAITIRDMVSLQRLLVRHLNVRRIELVIGGSSGGMQALEWAASASGIVQSIAPIATSGRHSAWAVALSEAQRQAIFNDPQWNDGAYADNAPPAGGLGVARMIAMSAYRSHASFESRFARRASDGDFAIATWLQHHGAALAERFDAHSYVALTRALDSHDLGRDRGSYEETLRSIHQPSLVVSIDSDVLYPPVEQEELAMMLPNARFETLHSIHGHDAFLIELQALNEIVAGFRQSTRIKLARPA